MHEPVIVTDQNFDTLVKSMPIVLVDFYSESCVPCKQLSVMLDELITESKDPDFMVMKVDVNKAPTMAARYNVRSVPTLILFEMGVPSKTLQGMLPKKELLAMVGR